MNIKMSWQPWLLPLLSCLLFLTSRSQPTNNEATNASDLSALLSFKSLIRNDPRQALSSWEIGSKNNSTPAPDFCQWTGVVCSDRRYPGRVTALHLRGFSLAGTISPQLSNLTHLQELDLSANNLYGEIPYGLTGCTKLYALNMSMNFLSGSIPTAIGHLSKLIVFNVRHNNLTGDIPFSVSNLTALTLFSVESNYFDVKIPNWLGNLTSMETFDLSKNSFHGHIPAGLGKMTKLVILNIQANQLEGFVPLEIFNISSIKELDLGFNQQLSGSLPTDIGFKLPRLNIFTIMANKFEGPIPVTLSNASALEYIYFRENKFSGQIPQDIGIHGQLRVFSLGNNYLQATEPKDWGFLTSLTNCTNLGMLDLERNNLVGVMPITIANLSKELDWIAIARNKISGRIPAEIGMFHKLTNLTLADNLFIGKVPPEIGQLPRLQYIDLSHNRFHGQVPQSIGNITQLSSLSLSNNILDGSIPTSLGNLTNLRAMDLSCNLLGAHIPQEILSIFTLTILNLSNNALSGSISPQMGHLNNLRTIDLSMNKLSGEIPETISGCIELQFLYLQGNILQGKIPEGLNSLRGLEKLDLSNNHLAGPIPVFLENFTFLTRLNLSFNNMYGPVPNTGIFRNTTILSLQGNSMLCGGPPSLELQSCQSTGHHKTSEHRQHVLLFCILGTLIVFICSTTAYCFMKRSDPNVDEENIILNDKYERISYAELHAATESFSPAKLIGSGSYSNVYIGNLIVDENLITVAIKVLNLGQQGAKRSFLTECDALRRIRHRKLVKVITVCSGLDHNGDEFKALVLEFICNGTLYEWLHPNKSTNTLPFRRLGLMERFYIALDVAEALEYLHHHIEPPIVHCDIKSSNILLDDDMVAHVTDFGLAKILHSQALEQNNGETESQALVIKGTIGYVAPEYGSGSEVSTDGDIYSYGVLLLEIFTGRRPTDSFNSNVTNLVDYVKLAYPNNLLGVLDASAVNRGETQDTTELVIYPIFRIALACCENSPRQRMKMDAVVEELNAIKKACTISKPFHQLQATT